MARPLRYLPPDCPLVEVTCRALHGRILLRPSRELNQVVLGVLARAARLYQVGVCAFIYLSRAPGFGGQVKTTAVARRAHASFATLRSVLSFPWVFEDGSVTLGLAGSRRPVTGPEREGPVTRKPSGHWAGMRASQQGRQGTEV